MNRYFYGLNNERHGPVTEPALEQLLRNGVLTGDTLLWASGMEGWQPLRTVFPSGWWPRRPGRKRPSAP